MATISVQRTSVTENDSGGSGTFLTFQLTLSEPLTSEVSVDYLLDMGTAVNGDLTGADLAETVTFAAGETTKLLSFRTLGDSIDEVDESVWLSLLNPVGASLEGEETTLGALGVINDNDGSGNNLSMFVSDPRILEDDSGVKTAVFEVHLSQAHGSNLTFNYQTADGSAKAGSDYVATNGTVTFLAGQTTASIAVEVNGDTDIEASEFFSLVVTPTADIANGTASSTGVATIMDDDSATGLPVITVQRAETTENDSGGSGTSVTFQINLSEASADEITIDFDAIAGSAIEADFTGSLNLRSGKLTIDAGETTALLSFQSLGDDIDEVDEAFWLKLFNPVNAVLASGEKEIEAIGIVRDDDGTGSNLALFVSSPEVAEGNNGQKTAVFEIHLSQAYSSALTFNFETADGTAKAGSDYVAAQGSVTFLAGQTVATVEVAIKGDRAIEKSEQFSLVVTPTAEIKNGPASHSGMATILNDDSVNETIEGTTGADKLFGKGGIDYLYGFSGNDVLDGGAGNDVLSGEAGKDTLIGGKGADELQGGAGADRFVFRTLSDSSTKVASQDLITNFNGKSGDRIDLDDIDANTKRSGDQDFDFIGAHAFTRAPGQLRVDKVGGDTFVFGDVNGDRKADFAIHLDGSVKLIEDYFIL